MARNKQRVRQLGGIFQHGTEDWFLRHRQIAQKVTPKDCYDFVVRCLSQMMRTDVIMGIETTASLVGAASGSLSIESSKLSRGTP